MRPLQLSSGDLLADRRSAYAAALAESGDHAAAADLMAQVLDIVPDWTAGWCLLGDYAAEANDRAGAISAYEQLARLDSAGLFGAALKLASLGASPAPGRTDIAYVEALFDDYAARFDSELIQQLAYAAPAGLDALIAAELDRRGMAQVGHALDLGCGTGLMGERLRRRVSFVEGVDLSAAMLDEASRKGIYDRLEKAELGDYLLRHPGGLDLVTAADVLNYCGALGPVLSGVAARLAPGGLVAFSVELHDGPEPMLLRPTLRYVHSRDAARRACTDAGLDVLAEQVAPFRTDRGEPVMGLIVLASRSAPRLTIGLPADEQDRAEVSELPSTH